MQRPKVKKHLRTSGTSGSILTISLAIGILNTVLILAHGWRITFVLGQRYFLIICISLYYVLGMFIFGLIQFYLLWLYQEVIEVFV